MNTSTKLAAHSRRRSGAVGLIFAKRIGAGGCDEDGDCWHVHEDYAYPPGARIVAFHPDDWRWAEGEHHAWREHPGRGYWHGGAWAPF